MPVVKNGDRFSEETIQIVRIVEGLDDTGKQVALAHVTALQDVYSTQRKTARIIEEDDEQSLINAWTGYFRGFKKKENIIYPVWE